ncbi:hypothetical protein HF263_23005 [Rhizobium leguminosarum]|uniref:hypothetical protein n=1 Tax=Rhizobium leguminosarum TaxID=384 RepID=UPI001C91C954|nr:hypothetical protein [Rhizobium leguminosarum]MBY2994496.1 hypothetical protein [Rhizobium leguminosarum]MBY3058924.1 hypothetical protein [Rhizobium leguminosarum]
MSKTTRENDRDHALFAFHRLSPRPTAEQIIEWTKRYPEFADDIRTHAAISRDWDVADSLNEADEEISETMKARAHSRVLNALFLSESPVLTTETETTGGFHEVLEARGQKVHEVAKQLDIGRDVLADLFNGWMTAPVGRVLADAVRGFFGMSAAAFELAYQYACDHPKLGHAKSSGQPTIPRRSYEEIVAGSNMSPERKKYWLGET